VVWHRDGVSRLDLAHHDDRAALSEPCPITAAERVTDCRCRAKRAIGYPSHTPTAMTAVMHSMI
jgi:hypothetical protein